MKHLACIPINGRTIGRDGSNYDLGGGPRMNKSWGKKICLFFVFSWSPRQRSSPKTQKWALVHSLFAKERLSPHFAFREVRRNIKFLALSVITGISLFLLPFLFGTKPVSPELGRPL